MRSLDLAGALGIDKAIRSADTREQDAAFLEGFADRGDPKTQSGRVESLAAGIKRGIGDDLLVAVVDAAAGKYQRPRAEIDLVVTHHHKDFDFAPGDGTIAQQQDG